jgi:phosphate/sulfate permease
MPADARIVLTAHSIAVGARVAETIRTKIVDVDVFEDKSCSFDAGYGLCDCSVLHVSHVGRKAGMPVSTTHSIRRGVISLELGYRAP